MEIKRTDGKNVSIFHKANGKEFMCPGKTIGRSYCDIRHQGDGVGTYLSAYWVDGVRFDVTDQDMRKSIKATGRALKYPTE